MHLISKYLLSRLAPKFATFLSTLHIIVSGINVQIMSALLLTVSGADEPCNWWVVAYADKADGWSYGEIISLIVFPTT